MRSQRLRIPLAAVAIGLVALAEPKAAAQVPSVYDDEHTGEKFSKPVLPDFDELPIVRPLPDPFAWSDGSKPINRLHPDLTHIGETIR